MARKTSNGARHKHSNGSASNNDSLSSKPSSPSSPYVVNVSGRFILSTLAIVSLLAFGVGTAARVLFLDEPALLLQQKNLELKQQLLEGSINHDGTCLTDGGGGDGDELPTPILKGGKVIPHTEYTSKHFDTAESARTYSRWVMSEDEQRKLKNDLAIKYEEEEAAEAAAEEAGEDDDDDDDDEIHLPAGQHLLMDIKNVEPAFLNSERRLAQAMIDLVNDGGLTLLSYHCHGLKPAGVSCVGVLLESHVSFHTWPAQGVITLDLFTCGDQSLLPAVPLAEKLFAIPDPASDEDPYFVWQHAFRGFREDQDAVDVMSIADMYQWPLGAFTNYKKQIASVETDFQTIDIYDVIDQRRGSIEEYEQSLSGDGSYFAEHPEYFAPDRIVYLDGMLQSRRNNDAAYHEALVHPSLFAHPNPKRVAIIGGGEGATLRDVLKHNTIEKVIMIEIDEMMVTTSKEYLREWNDCSDIVGSTFECTDDPRVELYFEDAFKWFFDRFGNNATVEAEAFDVIIMDALDPQAAVDFAEMLYTDAGFYSSIYNGLTEQGLMVSQVGASNGATDPSDQYSMDRHRTSFVDGLIQAGFEHVRAYEEGGCGFFLPWSFIVAFKSYQTKTAWFDSEAEVNVKVAKRSMQTKTGGSPFLHFDGATMGAYMFPPKSWEIVFCHRDYNPTGCDTGHGFNPEYSHIPLSKMEVKKSGLGEKAGRGLFTTVDIRKESYIGLDEQVIQMVYMSPKAENLCRAWPQNDIAYKAWGEKIEAYTYGYGHSYGHPRGAIDVYVDGTIQTFINHGCDNTNNVGHDLPFGESTVPFDHLPDEITFRGAGYRFNPVFDRQVHFYSSAIPRRNIKKGEELLDNYLGMRAAVNLEDWQEDVELLRQQCER